MIERTGYFTKNRAFYRKTDYQGIVREMPLYNKEQRNPVIPADRCTAFALSFRLYKQ